MIMSSQRVSSCNLDFLLLLLIITLMIFTVKAQPRAQQANHFKLALQWPPSFCNNRTSSDCDHRVSEEMTIHGLWAFDVNDHILPDCPSNSGVDLQQNVANVKGLDESWPSHVQKKSNFAFWSQEWNKHGRCLQEFQSAEQYFQKAVDLKQQIDDRLGGSLVKFFRNQNLPPNDHKRYSAFGFLEKIKSEKWLITQMQCNTNRQGKYQLYEIRFCFTTGWKFKNCSYYNPQAPPTPRSFHIGSCYRKQWILFPQAPPLPKDEL